MGLYGVGGVELGPECVPRVVKGPRSDRLAQRRHDLVTAATAEYDAGVCNM